MLYDIYNNILFTTYKELKKNTVEKNGHLEK